jgi:protein SCO1/2
VSKNCKGLLLLVFIVALAACKPSGGAQPGGHEAVKRYELKGKVVEVNVPKKRVTVAHEEIPNYMESMTMPFAIRDNEMLNALAPGDVITGLLIVENNQSWIEVHSIVKQPEPIPGASAAPQVRPGDEVPNVELLNQDSNPITIRQFRGKLLMLTFIYTRCPLPDYCILMSENFGAVSKELANKPELKKQVRLLSVSLDPAFDKPPVLKSYGTNYMSRFTKTDFNLWSFATGNEADIRHFAGFFGLTYRSENNQIVHSLRTALIDKEGKVLEVFDDNEWKPQDAMNLIEKYFKQN